MLNTEVDRSRYPSKLKSFLSSVHDMADLGILICEAVRLDEMKSEQHVVDVGCSLLALLGIREAGENAPRTKTPRSARIEHSSSTNSVICLLLWVE